MKILQRTKEIEIKGVKFVIGFIKPIEWDCIKTNCTGAFPKLYEFIRKTPAEELKSMSAQEVTAAVLGSMSSEEVERRNRDLFKAQWEMIRLGVKGHSGFIDDDGSEIPFALGDDGKVSEDMVEAYHVGGLFLSLANEIEVFNSQREVQKKNS